MPATDSGHSQHAIVDVADQLFAAIERSDEARLSELFDDDIAVWRVGARRDDDKERALKVLRWFVGVTENRRYEVLDRQLFCDGFVQQHILHATVRNGGSIALRVCIVIKLDTNALIRRIDEYFDPAELAPLMSPSNRL
ncbi:MAG TPA: nuclear transport factor 2 family protein [Mycobacterium sp.]